MVASSIQISVAQVDTVQMFAAVPQYAVPHFFYVNDRYDLSQMVKISLPQRLNLYHLSRTQVWYVSDSIYCMTYTVYVCV